MLLSGIESVSLFFAKHSWVSLTVILSTLAVSILYSVLETRMIEKREAKLSANYEAAKAKKDDQHQAVDNFV